MTVTFRYDPKSNIVQMTGEGVVKTEEIHAYLAEILANESIVSGFIEIADLKAVTDLEIRYSEVAAFEEMWQRYLAKGCRATIIYAPSDVAYGTTRMLQTVIRLSREDAANRFVVVRTKDAMKSTLTHFQKPADAEVIIS